MSRRAKLLIAALFLVPLFMLALYVILTWAPEEPLHFHAVEVTPGENVPPGWRTLEFVVENTSWVPIHLNAFAQRSGDNSYLDSYLDIILDPDNLGAMWSANLVAEERKLASYIPARSRVRTWRFIRESELQKYRGHLSMEYTWVSHTRERFYRFSYWLSMHGPSWLRPHLPRLILDYDTAPITVPANP